MPKFIKKKFKNPVVNPGIINQTIDKKTEQAKVTLIAYDELKFEEKEISRKSEDFLPSRNDYAVNWINIDGLYDVEIIEKIGKYFNLHPLVLEDISSVDQRPKWEDFGDYILIVLKMISYDVSKEEIDTEQVSLIIGADFVISFQEKDGGDVFDPARERLRKNKGKIRKMGADYLAYCLIDMIVDNYYLILEKVGERIVDLEGELISNPVPETMQTMHYFKREIIFLRKAIWPLREIISGLQRKESTLIKESTGVYLRDVYDHTIQIIDTIESFRDMIAGMLDLYLSSVSNKMNEVVKVLTIFAAIFIPLTFIVGLYGMNFKYMPELNWRWGYFVVLGIMASVVITMLIFFKKKKWF